MPVTSSGAATHDIAASDVFVGAIAVIVEPITSPLVGLIPRDLPRPRLAPVGAGASLHHAGTHPALFFRERWDESRSFIGAAVAHIR